MSSVELAPVEGPLCPLSWSPTGPVDRAGLAQAWERLAQRMGERGLAPLMERIHVDPERVDEVLDLRAEALGAAGLDAGTPVTVVANPGCHGGPCAGVQLLCWETVGQGQIRTVPGGRLLDLGRSRALFLADLRPTVDSTEPVRDLFDQATSALARHGMAFGDVGRTWVYLRDLLADCPGLDRIRDEVYEAHGLGRPGAWRGPPASTGIQGRHPDGLPCFMELVAVSDLSGRGCIKPVGASVQREASSCGPALSRASRLLLGNWTLTTISGTASIGADGASLHVGDPEAQIRETFAAVESLLASCYLPPRAPGLWTLYFKDETTWRAWRGLVERGELADVEGAALFADACRPELLFELEVTAAG